MKLSNTKLNIILSVIIVLLVIYFTYLNYENEKNTIKEGNIGRKIRNTVNRIVRPIEKKLLGQMLRIIQQALSPITGAIKSITKQLTSITDIVTDVIDGLKSGIVTPVVDAFENIGLMFSQIGLLIFDFLLKIAQIPNCLISYITWIFITLKDQFIMTIFLPIIQKILKKIFGRFYPATIVGYFIKFLDWLINFNFYILSLFGSFLGINEIFYKEKCFNFTGNFKKRIDKMKKHLNDAGNSFAKFGDFKF